MRVHPLFAFVIVTTFTIVENRARADDGAASPSQLRMQWVRDTTVSAYETAGMKDPKWDDLARRTLEAAGRTWGRSPRRNGDEDMVVMYSSLEAINAGCRDQIGRAHV